MRALMLLCAASVAPTVHADTVLSFDTTDAGAASTVQLVDGAVRIDGGESGEWMLYKADEDTLFIISPTDRSYTRVDEAGIRKLGGQMDAARAEWEAEMAKLPPEQRAMAEQMMQRMTGGRTLKKTAPPEPQATGSSQSVAGVKCENYVVEQRGAKETLCVAAPDDLGMSDEEYETVQAMYALLAKLSEATGFAGSAAPRADKLPGVPVLIDSQGGERKRNQRLTGVKHPELRSSVFALPSGYAERDPSDLK
ncbi:hypothetical protein [uncultured Abyssibacter sp.]|uniref:hypothetical protein n=1 Tax=uncultured Abyssibacter sp. TaxID=2320202 RepID=UPI0032B27B94